ncbi:phospholipase A2 inhibitor gamma subunit B-like [Varanus komodoensis]|uniref:phospholipase A2 inhibitor gamma subunit B-like n=1 Tax=Varanus komodoensis TaxID=61221 RepID=UPI001CF7D68A|nr:phospholipase A2 inhibitor gamma subunit B-like [Varanus komodoensis]
MDTCISEHDSCATIQSEFTGGGNFYNFFRQSQKKKTSKICTQSSNCFQNHTILNVGRGQLFSAKLSCCSGDTCKRTAFPLPLVNVTPNGKRCNACYSYRHPILACWWKRTAQCAGDENYCIELYGRGVYPSPGTVRYPTHSFRSRWLTIKGCVNKAYCDAFHAGPVHVATLTVIGTGSCKLASKAVSTSARSLGGLLLTGFLLVKVVA